LKYLDLITDALRLRNIIDENQTASPEQALDGLRKLNQMCAAWKARGIDIQYFPTNSLSDTLTLPDWAEQGVTAQLAIRFIAGAPISDAVAIQAREGMDTIRTKTIGRDMGEPIDSTLPAGEADRRRGGFFNG
jgi:hypothetical protein